MGTTANYGWTYPDSGSNANLWEHFETLADGIDTSLGDLQDDLDAMAPSQADSSANNASPKTVSTSTAKGDTTCGLAFTAPPSGRVMLAFNGVCEIVAGTGRLFMGPELKTGATIGSGTVTFDPTSDPGCKIGSGDTEVFAGGCTRLVTGLTPGSSYNVCAVYWAESPASMTMNYYSRSVAVYPQH